MDHLFLENETWTRVLDTGFLSLALTLMKATTQVDDAQGGCLTAEFTITSGWEGSLRRLENRADSLRRAAVFEGGADWFPRVGATS